MKRIALVTGASRGLGAAIAKRLAADGMAVMVNYRSDMEGAASIAESINNAGGEALVMQGDVTDADQVRNLIGEIERKMGPLSCLVNNAVPPHEGMQFKDLRVADFDQQYSCSVRAPQMLLEQALEGMRRVGNGRIVNIGSDVQFLGTPDLAHYIMGKTAMQGLTRAWAKALAPFGITANMVCPGWTPVERHGGTEEAQRQVAEQSPMGRLGKPEDIASSVSWFCSLEASFVSGQLIAVNGASTLA